MSTHAAPLAVCFALLAMSFHGVASDDPRVLRESDFGALPWRSIGPANMGGRVAAICLTDDPKTYYIGYATGGLWKTTNNGTTFAPIFDDKETASIGAIGVSPAPSEADEHNHVVWVGTGEGNNRNSSSWGHGVYRSADSGATFEHVGLEDSHDIPSLAAHPSDPETCYIAALGHLWGANETRGVYKTSDGGATWEAVLRFDDRTGACDVLLDPSDPETVYAAMYARQRTPWSYTTGSEDSGIYKSTDGGASWTKLEEGLPGETGRIGLTICASEPNVLYACVESDAGGKVGDPFSNRSRAGGVFRSDDHGETWTRTSDFAPRSFYFSRINVDPKDPQRVYLLGWEVYVSDDGGKTFRAGGAKVAHVDHHAMVIDPEDTDHLLIGNDGGLYVSWDRGATWDFHNHMAAAQFYNVAVDDSDPYRVGGGLQDNGSWIGPSASLWDAGPDPFMGRPGAITNHDWKFVNFGDGFHLAFDPTDPDVVYAESQGGYIRRVHLSTGQNFDLQPEPKEGQARFRFNWNAPFFVSPHAPTTLYLGGNRVFKLTDRGESWEAISPDLTTNDIERVVSVGSEAETYGTIVSLSESPVVQGVLWAGSDDGLIHVTMDGGGSWEDVTPAEVDGLYIACIESSHADAETAYVCVDGHRSDRFEPILLMTTDGGASWRSIVGDLPATAPCDVVREDPTNPDVLYLGTEQACYVTIDRGAHWVKLNGESLPTVRVDDLKVHGREHDLVAGTHGRSIYILDDASAIGQLTPEVVQSDFHVFEAKPGRPRLYHFNADLWSDRKFIASNPPMGGMIHYWIGSYTGDDVSITIEDENGVAIRKLGGTNHPGINRIVWDLQAEPSQRLGNPHGMTEFVPAGVYTVKIVAGEHSGETVIEVLPAPGKE